MDAARSPRIGAVLLLAYQRRGEPHVVFTQRSQTVVLHQGQVSLPGGSREAEDSSLEVTALRETSEELGVRPSDVEVLGRLDDVYVLVSNFLIAPVVGVLHYEPMFQPEPSEVAEVIEVPLSHLQNPTILREEDWLLRGELRAIQFYEWGPHKIWGATARVIQEFLDSKYPDLVVERLAADQVPTGG